jgi:uncharacterized protein (DUF983 family)
MQKPPNATLFKRALKKRCPRCGNAPLFFGFYNLHPACPACKLDLATRDGDTWAFTYITTGFLTGVFIIAMLLYKPQQLWLGRILIVLIALTLMTLTMPLRKSFAIALDYAIAPDDTIAPDDANETAENEHSNESPETRP